MVPFKLAVHSALLDETGKDLTEVAKTLLFGNSGHPPYVETGVIDDGAVYAPVLESIDPIEPAASEYLYGPLPLEAE
jgi:hypothetical protein